MSVEASPLGNGSSFSKDAVGGIPLGIGGGKFELYSGAANDGLENVTGTGGIGVESVEIAVQYFNLG